MKKFIVKVHVEMTITKIVSAVNADAADEIAKKRLKGKCVRLKTEHFIDASTIYQMAK